MSVLIRNLGQRCVVFVVLMVIMTAVPRFLPGDTVDTLLLSTVSADANPSEEAELRQRLGLDGEVYEQIYSDLWRIAQGDFGFSIPHGAAVTTLLVAALPWTALLVCGAMPIALIMGVFLGMEAGRHHRHAGGRHITTVMSVLASVPPYIAAVFLLLIFSILWPLLPSSGAESILPPDAPLARMADVVRYAVLPVTALALHEVGRYFFLVRGETILLSRRVFMQNARSRGVQGGRLRRDYFGRNLLHVVLARLGQSVSTLFTASLFVEVVFSYPGIGALAYQAVLDRDYPLLQGTFAVLGALILGLHWLFDAASQTLAERG